MSSQCLLFIADRNAQAVSLLQQGQWNTARLLLEQALQEFKNIRARLDTDCTQTLLEDGTVRCYNDAPLNSMYPDCVYAVPVVTPSLCYHHQHQDHGGRGRGVASSNTAAVAAALSSSSGPYHRHQPYQYHHSTAATPSILPIYQAAFLHAADVPIAPEATGAVLFFNLALVHHRIYQAIKVEKHRRRAVRLYKQASVCLNHTMNASNTTTRHNNYDDNHNNKNTSVALLVMSAAILINVAHVESRTGPTTCWMEHLRRLVQSMGRHKGVNDSDTLFFTSSLLILLDVKRIRKASAAA